MRTVLRGIGWLLLAMALCLLFIWADIGIEKMSAWLVAR